MAEVRLVRVDYRLIHGQVAVKWSKVAQATKIVVVDNESANSDMLKAILKMAAPANTKALVYSTEKAVSKWREKKFGDGIVMVVIKDIDTLYELYKKDVVFDSIQLGNCPKKGEMTQLSNEVYVNDTQLKYLDEIAENGIDIYMQTVPDNKKIPYKKSC